MVFHSVLLNCWVVIESHINLLIRILIKMGVLFYVLQLVLRPDGSINRLTLGLLIDKLWGRDVRLFVVNQSTDLMKVSENFPVGLKHAGLMIGNRMLSTK